MALTIYEIAEKAGVSIATISRAMNPKTRKLVAEPQLKKIDDLVAKLGYTQNCAAKNLSRAAYETIGVLVPHHAGILQEPYYSKILCGVADALLESNYRMKMIMMKCEKPRWDKYNFKAGEGVDGLIVTHWHAFFSDKAVLENLKIPCAVINDMEANTRAFFACGDHFLGGKIAAHYLHAQGHRKLGVMTGPADSSDSHLRLTGFQEGLFEKGMTLHPKQIICGEFQESRAFDGAEMLLKDNPDLTAIFCLNDGMAFGVQRKLMEMGIACPERISVMGYDNEPRGESSHPPLTSIQVPLYELAHTAAQNLTQYLNGIHQKKIVFKGKTILPVKLVERKSVRRIS